ncbi:MAG: poly-beta,6-N-acetyl-D-glucosamine synthase [Clostridiales bacterium]|nr:poly-beta,6-N-acetyl-D-glucosamine synthase [Clostridiales bacterium]
MQRKRKRGDSALLLYITPLIIKILSYYVFIYPIAMSIIWIIGGLYFWMNYELKNRNELDLLKVYPDITILVPCHNEAETIALTCKTLSCLDYTNYHVIFIDDASEDNTAEIIRKFIAKNPFFHLISLKKNQGKAGALNKALGLINTPFVLVLDADTIISGHTLKWLVLPLIHHVNIGAVTANPIPYNRASFLGKFQTAEFMSIIGLIKRSQSIFGYLFTVSGCATLYNTDLLRKLGGFSTGTATEDIDATWQIQRAGYRILFQAQAIALIQVPNKLREYWKQRKRWATGGWHFLRTHKDIFFYWHLRHLWLLYLDFVFAYTWAFCLVITLIICLFSNFFVSVNLILLLHCTIVSFICLVQMAIAIEINTFYDKEIKRCFFWVPWYPIFFFLIGAILVVWTAPKSLFGSLENSGKWKSPKRVYEDIPK